MSLDGKVVVITGAASGIGQALAVGFAGDGARVVGFDIDKAGLEKSAEACKNRLVTIEGDVTSEADVDRLLAASMEHFGGIDVLCNNAGIASSCPVHAPGIARDAGKGARSNNQRRVASRRIRIR